MNRAYSLFAVKNFDDEQRVITGIATTPTPDRVGDVVEPLGVRAAADLPLFLYHDSEKTVGRVKFGKPTKDGVPFEARLPHVQEVGTLRDRIDEAWQMLKYRLITGVSIGFRVLNDNFEQMKGGGLRFLETEILELSLVPVPANADATILTIKSLDKAFRAASGAPVVHLTPLPGVSGNPNPKGPSMTPQEQITAFEAKRAANVARMDDIMKKSAEAGTTLDETQSQEYDGLDVEVKTIDGHLVRLKKHQATLAANAAPVDGSSPDKAAQSRGGVDVRPGAQIAVKPNVEKGIGFTRYVKSQIAGRGNPQLALMHAENQRHWMDQTPDVITMLKTAVAGGTTTASGWASQLVYNQNLVGEFVELLRPQTVLGKLPGLTRVPFNVRISGVDSGSSANWVGQGKGIPVSKLNTLEVTLGESKVAGLVVLTKELVRSSEPSAELLVRNDLLKTIGEFSDRQFLDPNVAAVSNVNPASITNGVTATAATGTTLATLRTDVQTLFKTFINNNDDPTSCVWIMDPVMALVMSLMQNALGQPEFPQITMSGGSFFGLPVVVSNSANITGSPDSGHMIILAKTSDILFADNDGIEIDASDEASIEMSDAPANNTGTPTASAYTVSMFQTQSVAIKAVRPINWKKRRSTAVAYIKEAQYVAS